VNSNIKNTAAPPRQRVMRYCRGGAEVGSSRYLG
jgi:hypothetical protein